MCIYMYIYMYIYICIYMWYRLTIPIFGWLMTWFYQHYSKSIWIHLDPNPSESINHLCDKSKLQ